MHWLVLGVGYLGIHLLVYVLAIRHLRAFSSEKGIFVYHAISALALACLLLTLATVSPWLVDSAAAVGLLGLHGIYSVSFLELWSLAEGGYSLGILRHVHSLHEAGADVDLNALHRIGATKKIGRQSSLQRWGLVRWEGDRLQLTLLGAALAATLAGIAWTANLKKIG